MPDQNSEQIQEFQARARLYPSLRRGGMDSETATEVAVIVDRALDERPTRDEVARMLAEAQTKMLMWGIGTLILLFGILAAMMWRVFSLP